MNISRSLVATGVLALLGAVASAQSGSPTGSADAGRGSLPARWWEKASASRYFVVSPSQKDRELLPIKDVARMTAALEQVRAQGFSAIHVVSPADGGISFGGLDTKNHYAIRADAGDMGDFRHLVQVAHSKGLAVTISYNLGYISTDAPAWLKACDDVREGRSSPESRWFVWSDRGDAPPPPQNIFFNPPGRGFWEYSARAKKYFWTRWGGADDRDTDVRFPQYDWANPGFQQEAERIVRFWMNTGIDGIMMDAVNWNSNSDWQKNRRLITNVMASYGNVWIQGEGAGGFGEDPVPWIEEGGWNSVEDYGLGTWWVAGSHVIVKAFQTGDPRSIEPALRNSHDRVVHAGGILFASALLFQDPVVPTRREAPHLAFASQIGLGDLIGYDLRDMKAEPDGELQWLLRLKRDHPALQQTGSRRQVPTNADDKYYAFLRTAPDGGERVLVVLNFQRGFQKIEVNLSGLDNGGLVELKTGEELPPTETLRMGLYSYGYRFYLVKPPAKSAGR
jgi:glycosidase